MHVTTTKKGLNWLHKEDNKEATEELENCWVQDLVDIIEVNYPEVSSPVTALKIVRAVNPIYD